jgi:hypothetical protein
MINTFNLRVSLLHSVFIFAVLPSIFLWLTPVPVLLFAPLMFLSSFLLSFGRMRYWNLSTFIFLLLAVLISSWWALSGNIGLAIFVFSGYLGILYTLLLSRDQIGSLLQHTSIYVCLVALSFLGVAWDFFNLTSLFQVTNPNGDISYFIPFTFYGIKETLIRPSSIYFEPGYLGFYLISYLYCRKLMGIKSPTDWYLAFAGLITQSFTYIIVLGLYLVSSVKLKVSIAIYIKWIGLLLPICYMVLTSNAFEWVFDRAIGWLFDPLSSIRYIHLLQVLEILSDPKVLLFGMRECNFGSESCPTLVGNIFAPLVRGGLVTFAPVILGYLYLLAFIIVRKNFEAFLGLVALSVLMMSKPIYLQYPYCLMVGIFFKCLLSDANREANYD